MIYRLLISLFAAAVLLRQPRLWRARLGRDTAAPSGPQVWLHGASNGELTSARPVLERLAQLRPDLRWVITANTQTAVEMAEDWKIPQTTVSLAPLDLSWVSARVVRNWQVVAHLSLESELWPHRFRQCPGPVMLIGARMTEGTAKGWARVPALAQRTLARVRFASAQDAGSRDRLAQLGLPLSAQGPVVDLKTLYSPPQDCAADPQLTAVFAREKTWLAASTHEGEDETVLRAHALALKQDPKLRLILAPRHPRRADAIAALIETHGLTYARRSAGGAHNNPPGGAQVYLADTMGEMALWYRLAGRVFIAGTLGNFGGHTPYEPAVFGAALIHGPDVANHRAGFDRLHRANAAIEVQDAADLAAALGQLSQPSAQERAGRAAREALKQAADLEALCAKLLTYLPKA